MKQDKDYEIPAPGTLQVQQAVELEVLSQTELGYKALVDDRYIGLIYQSEISQPLAIGQYLKGWIKGLREDGKIDLTITKLDNESRDALEADVLAYLNSKGGVAPLSDKSTPEEIHELFATSKSNFKRAIGRLYKNKLIVIGKQELRITGTVTADTARNAAKKKMPAKPREKAPAPDEPFNPWTSKKK